MFPYKGYAGKWLYVDLTTGQIEPREYDRTLAEEYLGGNGLGARLLWEQVGPEVDPLAPGNLLIFATGPLVGTLMPNGCRMEVIAKSPLTSIYGDANAGGFFGPELKFAGWDGIVFSGRAPHPVYLAIADKQVELRDADGLWGLTTSQTEASIRRAWGDHQVKVAAIGPAGENNVRFASIQVTSQRSLGRCGLGAVMGSKRLKAVAARGHGSIHVADSVRFHDLALDFHRRLRANPVYTPVSAHGTPGIVTMMNGLGRFPTRNFQMGSFPQVDRISAEALEERAFVRHLACFGCPVGCDKLYQIPDGPHAGTALGSVEYETLNAMGANIWNADLDSILAANRLCDDLGLDTISAGRTISFAMELWEQEIINLDDTGGLALRWGGMDLVLRLLSMIARREGFGDLLAEGVRRAAQTIGQGADEYAMHVKGMEIAAQDGRAQKSMGLAHVTSNRGADHLKAFPVVDETGYPEEASRRYGEEYLPEMAQPLATKHKPLLVKDGEDFGAVVDSVGVCKSGGTFVFAELYWPDIAAALEAATGMEMDIERLKRTGERIYNLQRCYNGWHGITRADDRLPRRFTDDPSPSGNARGEVIDLAPMLDEYYRLRGWDPVTGWPTPEKLRELGLEETIERLRLAQRAPRNMAKE
ncbi:MAG: aldehyde ferredoxin oxidoreductase family protein [Chloroflexota bacterium]|nr:aldehyde ferredoxin oxidoreductase family protein [Chloroflexota bacterium]